MGTFHIIFSGVKRELFGVVKRELWRIDYSLTIYFNLLYGPNHVCNGNQLEKLEAAKAA